MLKTMRDSFHHLKWTLFAVIAAVRKRKLELIPGAMRRLEEPGAFDKATRLTTEWFQLHLKSQGEVSQRRRVGAVSQSGELPSASKNMVAGASTIPASLSQAVIPLASAR